MSFGCRFSLPFLHRTSANNITRSNTFLHPINWSIYAFTYHFGFFELQFFNTFKANQRAWCRVLSASSLIESSHSICPFENWISIHSGRVKTVICLFTKNLLLRTDKKRLPKIIKLWPVHNFTSKCVHCIVKIT